MNLKAHAEAIYGQVMAKHPKGATAVVADHNCKTDADKHEFEAALRALNKDLTWSYNWPSMGKIRIWKIQRRKITS